MLPTWLMPMFVEVGLTHQVVPSLQAVVVCLLRGGGAAGEHGVLMLFSCCLFPMLVEAGVTHQVVACFHTVVLCVVRGYSFSIMHRIHQT